MIRKAQLTNQDNLMRKCIVHSLSGMIEDNCWTIADKTSIKVYNDYIIKPNKNIYVLSYEQFNEIDTHCIAIHVYNSKSTYFERLEINLVQRQPMSYEFKKRIYKGE